MSYLATTFVIADGVTTQWPFSFAGVSPDAESGTTPYLQPSDVYAYEMYTDGSGNKITVDRAVTIDSPNVATIVGAPVAAGREIKIFRRTEIRYPLVDFRDLQAVAEGDLDLAHRQAIFLAQETTDAINSQFHIDPFGHLDAGGRKVINLAEGTDPRDGVNVTQHRRTVRVGDRSLTSLPNIAQRANKLIGFDSNGDVTVVLPVNESAADLALRLANSADPLLGSALVGHLGRSVKDALGDYRSIRNHGAVEGVNCFAALVAAAAANTGTIVVPPGKFFASPTAAQVTQMVALVPRIRVDGELIVNIPRGQFPLTFPLHVANVNPGRLEFLGDTEVPLSITEQVNVTGARSNWQVTLRVSTTAGYAVGDMLHTWDTDGTGCPEVHRGGWPITAIDTVNSTITVKNSCWYNTFPVNTITSSKSAVLRSVLYFNNCDGVVSPKAGIDWFNRIGIQGNADSYWSSTNVSGTEKGTHGMYLGSMTIALNGKPDNVNAAGNTGGWVSCGPLVAINGFDQQGVCVELGGRFWGDFVSASNCKRRSFYASTAAGIRAKHISGTGSFLDGAITDIGGDIYTSSESAFVGCGGAGISAAHGGSIIADTAIIGYCNRGMFATVSGVIQATGAKLSFCTTGALNEYGGNMLIDRCEYRNCGTAINAFTGNIRATASIFENNGIHIRATERGFVNASGATQYLGTGTKWSARAGGLILTAEGYFAGDTMASTLTLRPTDTQIGMRFLTTSDGADLVLATDPTGGGTFTNFLHLRHDVGIYSHVSERMSLGRASELFTTVFAKTGTINTSDGRLKTAVRGLTPNELAAAEELGGLLGVFQWLDSVAKKGLDAREHIGTTVQTAIAVLAKYELNPYAYGFICYDEWGDEYDEEGNLTTAAGDLFSFRMDQLSLFVTAGLYHISIQTRKRVDALELLVQSLIKE